jgi:transcriptional regulator with XRE-family HTH domain
MVADARDVLSAFGDAVRRLRVERRLSQERLAELANVNRTYLGDVERGERNVSLINVDRIASALELDLAELMTAVEQSRQRRSARSN